AFRAFRHHARGDRCRGEALPGIGSLKRTLSMHKIVFLDRSTIAPQIRLRRPRFDHELIEHGQTQPDEVVARVAGASIAIINKVPLPGEVLAQLPELRLVAVAATGTDCVDKAWCEAHGVAVS